MIIGKMMKKIIKNDFVIIHCNLVKGIDLWACLNFNVGNDFPDIDSEPKTQSWNDGIFTLSSSSGGNLRVEFPYI